MKRKTLFASLLYGTLATTAVLNPAMADVRVNGFATVAFGMSDKDTDYLGYNKKIATTPDSLAGLQFGFDINDSMTGTIQLLAKGDNDWQPRPSKKPCFAQNSLTQLLDLKYPRRKLVMSLKFM